MIVYKTISRISINSAVIILLVSIHSKITAQCLSFPGTSPANQYVTFGAATSTLGSSTFTLEAWIKKTGAGITTATGTGGITAVPIITKGRSEGETPANINMNYFLGLNATGNLTADFEDKINGGNHPVTGTAALSNNIWYHIAASYDGTTWRLYLNGVLDKELIVGSFLPENTSIQHAAIATAMNSSGIADGFFAGSIEEVRIWNVARTPAQIQANMNVELTSGTGLLGRWGLNDGNGVSAANSIAGSPAGTLVNTPTWTTGISFPVELWGLNFNGTSQYVTTGVTPANSVLNTASFTLETWFKKEGTGVSVTTGAGGIPLAIPLITKGTSEAETATADINYFLGINTAGNVLCADFEESQTSTTPSLNHPISGTTAIVNDTWYHAAATYDGNKWQLFLNGNLEAELVVGRTANTAVISPLALATSIRSNGTTIQGFFNGTMDEVRIWNLARTQTQIQASINQKVTTGTGLISRWGLDNGYGTTVSNSVPGNPNGTAVSEPFFVFGSPFNVVIPPPTPPTGLTATGSSAYQVRLGWTDNSYNETGFDVERSTTGSSGTYSALATVPANTTSYIDTPVNSSTQYCYRIRSKGSAGGSTFSGPVCTTTATEGAFALSFTPNTFVSFGSAPTLATQNFTVEAWFKRTATGTPNTTGTGGITIVPILTKGAPEGDGSTIDANYILGINSVTNVIAADFEEGTLSASPGLNHPLSGTTTILNNVWYHAAATFSNGVFNLYLNGVLENSLNLGINIWPQGASIQHSALGSMLTSTGTSLGYFAGVIDEARIWNFGRSSSEIQSTINTQIVTGQTGLLARWGLNDGNNTLVHSNAGTYVNGTVTGTGYSWVTPGAPYNAITSPAGPSALSVTTISSTVLQLNWTDNSSSETGFEIQRSTTGPAGTFTLLTTTAANAVTYNNTGLSALTNYCYRVRAINQAGSSNYLTIQCGTTTAAAPIVSSFNPISAGSGTTVTITGNNFTGTSAVSFGGTTATSFTILNSTTITAIVNSGTTGNVSVTTAGGTATLAGFTFIPAPIISSFTPASASTGSSVTITGTNFTGATAVSFGTIPATSFIVMNPTTITAVVGSGNSGNVLVTTAGGTVTSNGFIFTVPQGIADFRSKANGNFSSFGENGIWQYDQGGNNWINATQSPNFYTNNVIITHNVILDQAHTNYHVGPGRSLILGTGGTLTIVPTSSLTITGSADFGSRLVIFRSDANGTAALGPVTGTLSNANNVTVERYIPDNGYRAWRLLSIPTFGSQTIKASWQEGNAPLANNKPGYGIIIPGPGGSTAGFDATTSGSAASLLRWNGTSWSNLASTNLAISSDPNKAYFIFVRGDRTKGVAGTNGNTSATTLETNGTVYAGDQSTPSIPANSFGLVGNPYPSAINFTTLTRNNVNDVFYIWDSKRANEISTGAYQTFSNINNFTPVGGGSYSVSNTILESGQAFFVRTGASPGSLTFHENSKISGTNGNLGLRPATPAALVKMDTRLHKVSGSDNPIVDGNAVVFDNAYSAEVDSHDALKLNNGIENFAVITSGKSLAVEGRPEVKDEDVIAFKMWNMNQQDYQLEFMPSNLNIDGLSATLEDAYLNTSIPISLEASSMIRFTVDANAASSVGDRFRVIFKKTVPVATGEVKPAFAISPNPADGGIVNLQFINQAEGKYSVRLINEAGQSVYTSKVANAGTNNTQVINLPKSVTKGTYRVEIISPDKTRHTKTLLVSGKQ